MLFKNIYILFFYVFNSPVTHNVQHLICFLVRGHGKMFFFTYFSCDAELEQEKPALMFLVLEAVEVGD